MMKDLHKVSVVMPAFNCEKYIDESIRSVIEQSYVNWELIVVDDMSTDNTRDIIARFVESDKRIKSVLNDRNQGAAKARNLAIDLAEGRFIAFLDSDDLWEPDKLSRQIKFMTQFTNPFTFSSYQRISETGQLLSCSKAPDFITFKKLLKKNVIGCSTVIYDTSYFGKQFMPNIRKGQDYGLWLKLLKNVEFARSIPGITVKYRVRSISVSSNKLESSLWVWRVYRHVVKLNYFMSIYYFSFYALSGILDRIVEKVRLLYKKLEYGP
jgi:teichuronic acid biosynthesis glycosyltransferase TuaG